MRTSTYCRSEKNRVRERERKFKAILCIAPEPKLQTSQAHFLLFDINAAE